MKRSGGFTIVELMIVIVVAAIGIALAVPSFRDMVERKRLGGATEAAYEHLQRAKSQALKRSKAILVDFNVTETGWAIGFTDKVAGCDAEEVSGANVCDVDEDNDLAGTTRLVMRITSSDFSNVSMRKVGAGFAIPTQLTGECSTVTSSEPTEQACFDFRRGIAKNGAYDFASASDFDAATYILRLQVSPMGHINICIPAGEKTMPGYNSC